VTDEERERRLVRVEEIRRRGDDPYPVRYERDRSAASLHEEFAALEPGSETDVEVSVAGRLVLQRDQGRLVFGTLRDGSGTIQLFASEREMGAEALEEFRALDLGDWVGARGTVMTTRKGELSVKVSEATLLAKALRPLPDKWHGLADVDTRFRRRYVDLIVNEEARRVARLRSEAVDALRRALHDRGFVEVETPVLHHQAGGAAARPFVTHHNSLGVDLVLRIALELHLKRLIVGGMEKVFEIGRVFRNEGLSTRHNPEFTMLEAYEAFADYTDMMTLTEGLVSEVARSTLGTTSVEVEGTKVDLAPPWERAPMIELIRRHAAVDVHPAMPLADLHRAGVAVGIEPDPSWGPGKIVMEIYEKAVEPQLTGPVFVTDYPLEVSPLARVHRDDPHLVERFEAVVLGRELANAFSELNDPLDQRRRFEEQARLADAGDDEAHGVDDDFLRALEYGMPPSGGLGIGVDRLVMLLAGVSSIREVILFPTLRPEAPAED